MNLILHHHHSSEDATAAAADGEGVAVVLQRLAAALYEQVVPPEMRDVLADMAPKAYASYCESVHGTPVPRRSGELGLGTPYVGPASGADLE